MQWLFRDQYNSIQFIPYMCMDLWMDDRAKLTPCICVNFNGMTPHYNEAILRFSLLVWEVYYMENLTIINDKVTKETFFRYFKFTLIILYIFAFQTDQQNVLQSTL